MKMNHLDDDFAKIAELFRQYKIAISSINNISAIDGLKNKIVVQFWKTIQKSAISEDMKEHSDHIVKTVIYCLGKYSDKEPDEFSKITYKSIMNKLHSQVDIDEFEKKSGMHITDSQNRIRKQIEKAYKQYLIYNSDDIKAFIEYAVTYLGFQIEDLREYLNPKKSISLYANNKNNEDEYCVVDMHTDSSVKSIYAEKEDSIERIIKQLKSIDKVWDMKKENEKLFLSELLTTEILKDFSKNNISENIIDILEKTNFICKDMLKTFLTKPNYKLPSHEEIGKKYSLTETTVSQRLRRFKQLVK